MTTSRQITCWLLRLAWNSKSNSSIWSGTFLYAKSSGFGLALIPGCPFKLSVYSSNHSSSLGAAKPRGRSGIERLRSILGLSVSIPAFSMLQSTAQLGVQSTLSQFWLPHCSSCRTNTNLWTSRGSIVSKPASAIPQQHHEWQSTTP